MNLGSKRVFVVVSPLISLLILLSLSAINSGFVPASGSEATQADSSGVNIVLDPSSEIRFFVCEVTPTNGTSFLPNLTIEESAQFTLTDRDLDTMVMGNAIFDVSSTSNSPIVNIPGPDLMVVEMAGAERINVSITDTETGEVNSLALMPTPGNRTNNCDYAVNHVFVDLSSFGVPDGDSVSSIRFDNMGEPDTLIGSDIAEIFILGSETRDASQPTEPQNYLPFLPFFRQN